MATNDADISLNTMPIDELLTMRRDIDALLEAKGTAMQKLLYEIESRIGRLRIPRPTRQPKYRGPNGETWSGRGRRPDWIVAALKSGRTLASMTVRKR
jgi:DNA-binding protein H-NS